METAIDDGQVRLTIPTTIFPKYVPFSDNTPEAKKIKSIKYDFSSPAPLSFSVEALMKTKIEDVTSPSHNISTLNTAENRIPRYALNLYLKKVELKS